MERVLADAEFSGPLTYGLHFALVPYGAVSALVSQLRLYSRPPTVGWGVVAVVVFAVETQIKSVTVGKAPQHKSVSRGQPQLAHLYATAAIVVVARVVWVVTTVQHVFVSQLNLASLVAHYASFPVSSRSATSVA